MKKAIVFAGGGSKGAYQIGAWKALRSLDEHFDIATGTSIGSINAMFYVQDDYDAAFAMWQELKADMIMVNGINFDKSFESVFSQKDKFVPFIKNYLNYKGADVTPFYEKLQKYFDKDKFYSSQTDYALMTVAFPSMQPVEIKKSDLTDPDSVWKWIAASCTCFPVFPVMEINGQNYIDGGYYDNIPIASAFKLGAEQVVAIDLKTDNNHEGYLRHPDVKYIKPTRDLGTFLNFEREVLDRSIKLGYNDTMKAYKKYYGNVYTFIPGDDREYYETAAEKFLRILTLTEAAFDFSGSVRFQRVNKFTGCTGLLAEMCQYGADTALDLFFAALEAFLRIINYDDIKDYLLDDLLYELKTKVDRLYPKLEYDISTAFDVVKELVESETDGKIHEYKKNDSSRMQIIYVSLIRTLQQMTF